MKEILVKCRQGGLEKNLKSDIINIILIILTGSVLDKKSISLVKRFNFKEENKCGEHSGELFYLDKDM